MNTKTDIEALMLNMEKEKYYTVKYKYRGKEFEEFACYKQLDFGNYYFKQDNGDWLILKAEQIININNQNKK